VYNAFKKLAEEAVVQPQKLRTAKELVSQ